MDAWPEWWDWELELSPHLFKRMLDRGFTEADLRGMMADATALKPNHEPSRWVVETTLAGKLWEVIVEPDHADRVLVVVTAYPVE